MRNSKSSSDIASNDVNHVILLLMIPNSVILLLMTPNHVILLIMIPNNIVDIFSFPVKKDEVPSKMQPLLSQFPHMQHITSQPFPSRPTYVILSVHSQFLKTAFRFSSHSLYMLLCFQYSSLLVLQAALFSGVCQTERERERE